MVSRFRKGKLVTVDARSASNRTPRGATEACYYTMRPLSANSSAQPLPLRRGREPPVAIVTLAALQPATYISSNFTVRGYES